MINPQGFPDPWDGMGWRRGAGGSSVLSNLLHGGSKRVRQRVINTKIRSPRGGHYHLTPRTKTYNEHCEFPIFPFFPICCDSWQESEVHRWC